MQCDKCGDEAVMHAAYSGLYVCAEHLCQSVDSRVRRRIREDALLSDEATPEDPDTWLVGLSGGKDSVVLTHLLDDTFAADPRVELVALTVHEGIDGYRDASLAACLELTDDLGIATLDPGAHDPQDVNTLSSQFDVVIELREADDGGREVRVVGHHESPRTWQPL